MAFQEVKGSLGFGMMRLPMIGDEIDSSKTFEMVDKFLASGYSYFDTAYSYIDGKSEMMVKKALVERYPRESFQIATKLPAWEVKGDEKRVKLLFETSMERTGAGYFDYYLMHAVSADNNQNVYNKYDMWNFVRDLKRQGLVKNFGFSFHDTAQALEPILAENSDVDFIQLQINYADWESNTVQSRKCYEVARKYNKPIVIMEPVKGGLLSNTVPDAEKIFKGVCPNDSISSWAFKYCDNLDGVRVTLSGMSTMEQVEDNLNTFNSMKPLSKAEADAINDVNDILSTIKQVPCTGCGYCLEDCPQKIRIPGVLRSYNKYLLQGINDDVRATYSEVTAKGAGLAGDCISCGACEGHCPQHIEIINELADAAKILDR